MLDRAYSRGQFDRRVVDASVERDIQDLRSAV
jgi:hypothetical protein